jgi:DNA polymerase-3 subunit delta'
MLFSDVIGQAFVKEKLRDLVRNNRVSHAMLFLGNEGTGGLPLALAFSQYLLCDKRRGSPAGPSLFGESNEEPAAVDLPEPCNQCASCIKAKQLVHPDIHFSYPVVPKKSGDKPLSTDYAAEWRSFIETNRYGNVYDWLQYIKAENKQGNITAHECNDIIRKLYLKSFQSDYKVLIMWMPEFLGKEGNKLLKLIEEPPDDTVMIFVAENEALMLPTLLSRMQIIRLPVLSEQEIAEALIRSGKADVQTAKRVAGVSDGNFKEATNSIDANHEDWEPMFREWLNAIVKQKRTFQVKWIDEMSKTGREKQKQFLRYGTHLLETAVRVRLLGAEMRDRADSERDFAERLNKLSSVEQQEAMMREFDNATYYIERNANAKILFHALTIRVSRIINDKSLILIH